MSGRVVTLDEIYGQPSVWKQCLEALDASSLWEKLKELSSGDVEWLFVGCGTSYYLAQAAAASFATILKAPARAVPASEILLFPEIALGQPGRKQVPVLISRSGKTSEVVRAARLLRDRKIRFLGLTCDGNELATLGDLTLKLPVVEHSTVMTSSFTSMLLAMQYAAAKLAGDEAVLKGLRAVPAPVEALLAKYGPEVEKFAARRFADYVFLGQGIFHGLAQEYALKVTESSCSYSQPFHTLEFRHGPKSIMAPEVLTGFLLSERGYVEEAEVAREMKALGGTILTVANEISSEVRVASDLSIALHLDVPEIARAVAYMPWGQLLGSYTGLSKGLNPDEPKNLSRVVMLGA